MKLWETDRAPTGAMKTKKRAAERMHSLTAFFVFPGCTASGWRCSTAQPVGGCATPNSQSFIRSFAKGFLRVAVRASNSQKFNLSLVGGVSRNSLSSNQQRSIRRSDAPLLMWGVQTQCTSIVRIIAPSPQSCEKLFFVRQIGIGNSQIILTFKGLFDKNSAFTSIVVLGCWYISTPTVIGSSMI